MEIAIKSETDSRIVVYPLIKALYNYGTIAIYTSNKWMTRLIENQLEGGFKNIRVIVSPEGDLESCKEADGYYRNQYDFVIFDNIGAIDYDIMIAAVTNRISEEYITDLTYLITDPKTHILKFGKPAVKPKEEKSKKEKPKGKPTDEDLAREEEENRDFNKWREDKTDEQILEEALKSRDSKWINFPTYDDIELMEGRHIMLNPNDTYAKEIYRLFKDYINVDERMFMKGIKVKDESSSSLSGADVW